MHEPTELPASEVASRLAVTSQAVRDWIHAGNLAARKEGRRWLVDAKDFERFAQARRGREQLTPVAVGDQHRTVGVEDQLRRLAEAVARLGEREAASARLVEALERERDRFRAEAAASKEAALRVNAAAREIDTAVRRLLDVLELQADALTQLLAPASPEDLTP
jgi:excisionase family DNA binding protein